MRQNKLITPAGDQQVESIAKDLVFKKLIHILTS